MGGTGLLGHVDARLIEAFEAVGLIGEWSFDYRTRVFRSSPGVSLVFGLTAEEGERGQPVEVYERAIHHADVNWLRSTRAAPPGLSGLRVTEIRVIDARGRERWVMMRGRFALDGAERPAFDYGVMLDVTDYNAGGERPFVAPAAPLVDPHFVLLESLALAYRAARQLAQGAIERTCRDLLFRVAKLIGREVPPPRVPRDHAHEGPRRIH